MNKIHSPIEWVNSPETDTPINSNNLNKMDGEIGSLDDRIISMNASKASKTELMSMIADVSFNEDTGIFTFVRKSGATFTLDTKLEKIAVNFAYSSATQILSIILEDGTTQTVDLSSLITQYEFAESDTIAFTLEADGTVKANVKNGSITEEMLQPNYLAEIKVETANSASNASRAETASATATTQADRAKTEADRAKAEADRASENAGGDFATNAKVDAIVDGTTAVGNALKLNGLTAEEFQKTVAVNAQTNTLASLFDLVPNSGKARFIYLDGAPSDFPTNLGMPTSKGFLSVEVNKVGAIGYYNINAVYASGKPFNITGYYTGSVFYWNNNADGGNADTVDGWHIYSSLSELGLTEATATTVESIVTAMADNSMLLHKLGGTATSAPLQFPYNYSTLKVTKLSSSYVLFECIGTGNLPIYYAYYNGGSTNKWSGWSTQYLPLAGGKLIGSLEIANAGGAGKTNTTRYITSDEATYIRNRVDANNYTDFVFSKHGIWYGERIDGTAKMNEMLHAGNSAKCHVGDENNPPSDDNAIWFVTE